MSKRLFDNNGFEVIEVEDLKIKAVKALEEIITKATEDNLDLRDLENILHWEVSYRIANMLHRQHRKKIKEIE